MQNRNNINELYCFIIIALQTKISTHVGNKEAILGKKNILNKALRHRLGVMVRKAETQIEHFSYLIVGLLLKQTNKHNLVRCLQQHYGLLQNFNERYFITHPIVLFCIHKYMCIPLLHKSGGLFPLSSKAIFWKIA